MIDTLTSLRFFFALMVFGAHCYVVDSCFATHAFKEVFVGVSFFFVLSGFIIAYNYQDKMERQAISKRQFWVARIARVYPLHWLTLLGVVLVGNLMFPMGWGEGVRHFVPALFLFHPFVPKADYCFYFNSPSWSLGCEQLFYFLFPFLALVFGKDRRLVGGLSVCALAMPFLMARTEVEHICAYWYVNPLARFPDFLVGMLLFRVYVRCRSLKLSFAAASLLEAGVLCLFLLSYAFSADLVPKVYRYSCYYWVPVSLVLLAFSLQKGLLSRFLCNKWLVLGGQISYSFYLIHLWVLFAYVRLARAYAFQLPPYAGALLALAVTVGLGLLSYRYFEKPANHLVKRILNKQEINN